MWQRYMREVQHQKQVSRFMTRFFRFDIFLSVLLSAFMTKSYCFLAVQWVWFHNGDTQEGSWLHPKASCAEPSCGKKGSHSFMKTLHASVNPSYHQSLYFVHCFHSEPCTLTLVSMFSLMILSTNFLWSILAVAVSFFLVLLFKWTLTLMSLC